jgi:hypothetical protein
MGIPDDDSKISSILNELHNEIKTIISEAWNAVYKNSRYINSKTMHHEVTLEVNNLKYFFLDLD